MNAPTLPTTRWKLPEANEEIQHLLASELGISPIISQMLINRNILTPDDAKRHLSPSLNDLHNPFSMKDMQEGVNRLIKAIYNHEKVLVYGDYDADGITSVALLVKFLGKIHDDVTYYIPDRVNEGYSLNRNALNKIKSDGVKLIITVDCGISDYDETSYASSLGMDIIISDHHEVPDRIPKAAAVINPNRSDCRFPFKHLAGVGVAFNFLIALRGRLREDGFWKNGEYPNLKEYLDLVALGTIGDLSPLIGENRIFARIGLELITEGRRVGLKALKEVSGMEHSVVDSNGASFCLVPRINAAGRIGSPEDAVQLLLTDDVNEATKIARDLDAYNRERQRIEKVVLSEILDIIDTTIDLRKTSSLVFASSKWHPGVIGIVASRLVEKYYKPAMLISLRDGIGKGSGRSIAGFNMCQGLKRCDFLFLSYGGHKYAAGISINEENIEEFCNCFDEIVREDLAVSDLVPQTTIDAQCSLNEIDHEMILQLDMLAPFGSMNPEPVLCVKNVNVISPTVVGNNHLKMRISGDGISCDSIWFNKGHFIDVLSGPTFDITFTPQINYWNGIHNVQLKMKDIAFS
ncbi:MAG: single-stranded-DNA-specific exonuclease RecJ [Thermodesulfobacteriota bacterium]|nr:single-stranded-DNA-specific exonuclease RecJ [Thermodesulfobacteriota bacterium]